MRHPALPPRVSWPWLAVAAAVWIIVGTIHTPPVVTPVQAGQMTFEGVLVTDVVPGRFGSWALAETDLGIVLLGLDEPVDIVMGNRIRVEGVANGLTGSARGIPFRSRIKVRDLELIPGSASVPLAAGNLVRQRVMDRLAPFDDGRALLAGFLIGDTTELDRSDIEAMRLSGLSHFVAVSGSNVALFLMLLALAAGPLALGPKRRAVVGLLGLPIYAAATRFEPSVLRASVMAGIALFGRLIGIVLEAWQLLALAVVVLVVLDPSITGNVGFQLSVAATAGVMVGARWPVRGGRVVRTLVITCGAQVAVAPLIIVHFGSIPLLSPVTNLVAAPMVAGSTVLGAVGVAGVGFLVDVSAWLAAMVLQLSRGAAAWPQVTAVPLVISIMVGLVALRWKSSRPFLVIAGAVLVVVSLFGGGTRLPEIGVVVLDVGQGDSILVHGGSGRFALVDGGPDPTVMIGKLRDYGVTGLDLVILTHGDADHVAGLTGVVGRIPIGEIWTATVPHESPASREFYGALDVSGIAIRTPTPGETVWLGAIGIRVEAPLRRYASPNDQSIVVTLLGPNRSMLLTGDIEVVAQSELAHLRADILKVPHHGGGTSDPDWLLGVGAGVAVISVGENTFGHPVGWLLDLFESGGIDVIRTDLNGDIPLDL